MPHAVLVMEHIGITLASLLHLSIQQGMARPEAVAGFAICPIFVRGLCKAAAELLVPERSGR